MPRTAYKHLDREHPDPWVVWDEEEQAWRMARLIINPKRPEPLLVDDLGRRHRVGDQTRCQSLEELYRSGDVTLIPHRWEVRKTDWAPRDGVNIDLDEDMDNGFIIRRGRWDQ